MSNLEKGVAILAAQDHRRMTRKPTSQLELEERVRELIAVAREDKLMPHQISAALTNARVKEGV